MRKTIYAVSKQGMPRGGNDTDAETRQRLHELLEAALHELREMVLASGGARLANEHIQIDIDVSIVRDPPRPRTGGI